MTPAQLFDLNASRFGARAAAIMCEYRIRIAYRRALRVHLCEYENGEVLPVWKFHEDNARLLRGAIAYLDGVIESKKLEICKLLETKRQELCGVVAQTAAATS